MRGTNPWPPRRNSECLLRPGRCNPACRTGQRLSPHVPHTSSPGGIIMTSVSARLAAFATPAVGTLRNRFALFLLVASALGWTFPAHAYSGGGGGTSVPPVVGDQQATAESAITSAGLGLGTVRTAASSTVPSGNVISESPAAGTAVLPGSAVDLVVSTGVATANVCPGIQTTPAPCSDTILVEFNFPQVALNSDGSSVRTSATSH